MDRLPNDVIARVFSHLSTSDLGRFMSVCRSWNTLLSVSPNLWVKVEIPAEVSFEKAHQIIKISSTRSDSTLSTVCYPALLQDYEIAEMMGLLEESRGTIRETILDFSQVLLSKPLFGQLSPIDFFRGCSQLEELYLDGLDGSDKGGKRVSTSPGILTHFSCQEVEEIRDDQCHAFSNLKFFEVAATNGSASFLKVLSKCSQIEDLRLGGIDHCKIAKDLQAVLEKSFKKLRILHIGRSYHECCWNFEFCQDRLEELTIPAWIDANLFAPFKNLRRIHFKIPNHDEEDEDRRLENLQSLISHLGIHQEALAVLKLSAEEKGASLGYSVDQVLGFLRLNLVLGAPCPNLRELHMENEIDFTPTLLAQVLLSRRLLSQGYSIVTPAGIKSKPPWCSELILYLDEDRYEPFKIAEMEVLSRCSKWMRDAAGEATVLHI